MKIIPRTIPARFLRHAPAIAAANPSIADVPYLLRGLWESMQNPKTESTSSGGVLFTRDEDGDIEMWVLPQYMQERVDG